MSRYGASPLHLAAHLLALALAGFALVQLLDTGWIVGIAVWLTAAVVVHDMLLLPLYSGLDRAARPLGNHVRVPAGLSALLLLVYLPAISGRGAPTLERVSGRPAGDALTAWLAITAGLFALSGLVALARRRGGS
jgi:hypothetical protein